MLTLLSTENSIVEVVGCATYRPPGPEKKSRTHCVKRVEEGGEDDERDVGRKRRGVMRRRVVDKGDLL
jgi:hypothetical protein